VPTLVFEASMWSTDSREEAAREEHGVAAPEREAACDSYDTGAQARCAQGDCHGIRRVGKEVDIDQTFL
jgi:hypothetical protein